jgi:hypothetical protein
MDMENKKLTGFARLAKKTAAIFGTAFAALISGNVAGAMSTPPNSTNGGNTFENFKQIRRPMSVLKLNPVNPEQSMIVAQHSSHSSHSSHGSHSSHTSHASHASSAFIP